LTYSMVDFFYNFSGLTFSMVDFLQATPIFITLLMQRVATAVLELLPCASVF
jgi:hypothetical protein